MKNRFFLFLIIICLFISPVYIQGQALETDFTPVDTYFLGRAVAANILSAYKPAVQNPQTSQYLNRICQTLVLNSNHQKTYIGYYVSVLDSDEYNAFATPAGHIFITKKLVESADSEDMLAAVIAHELAHIMLEHGIKIINETRAEDELTEIANWAAARAAQYSAEAARAANFRSSITKAVDILMKNGYSIAQEYEADMEAVVLLANAGYDPKALLEILRKLQQAEVSRNSGLFSTHPSPAQRINNLETLRFGNNNTSRYRNNRFREIKSLY